MSTRTLRPRCRSGTGHERCENVDTHHSHGVSDVSRLRSTVALFPMREPDESVASPASRLDESRAHLLIRRRDAGPRRRCRLAAARQVQQGDPADDAYRGAEQVAANHVAEIVHTQKYSVSRDHQVHEYHSCDLEATTSWRRDRGQCEQCHGHHEHPDCRRVTERVGQAVLNSDRCSQCGRGRFSAYFGSGAITFSATRQRTTRQPNASAAPEPRRARRRPP